MSTLHLLSTSPFTHNHLDNALLFAGAEDALLLTGDAVYALIAHSEPFHTLAQHHTIKLFVLEEDLIARNVQNTLEHITVVGYDQFVTLCIDYTKTTSWL